jgi:[acyl-carrier-protein] S-malonyltransferase
MESVACLFPGQGSQYVGMGQKLWKEFSIARERFEEAEEVLGWNIRKCCFEGEFSELTQTMNAQPAILILSVISFEIYMQEIGILPQWLAGHSLGEYSALVCSKALTFSDAVSLVRARGMFMQQAAASGVGAMAAVSGIDTASLEILCSQTSIEAEPVVIACRNTAEQNVVSGSRTAVYRLIAKLEQRNVKYSFLQVSGSFHSPLMAKAAIDLEQELKKYTFQAFQIPVISNVTANEYSDSQQVAEVLKQQMTMPVRWHESMELLRRKGVTQTIELGPKTILSQMMKKIAPAVQIFSLESPSDLHQFGSLHTIAGQNHIEKLERCLTAATITRNRNENITEYEREVIPSVTRLKKMVSFFKEGPNKPILAHEIEAIELLKLVLLTKKVPEEEQEFIFNTVN